MNRKLLKKVLIMIGVVLLIISFSIYFDEYGIDAILLMINHFVYEFYKIDSILAIVGLGCLFIGIRLNENNVEINSDKYIRKYKIIRILGFLPFVCLLCYSIYCFIFGFTFFETWYGFKGFYQALFWFSVLFWPLYIVGIILIVISFIKLRKVNKK